MAVRFDPLQRDDFAQIVSWMAEPEVFRWYAITPKTLEDIEARYGPCIDGTKPNRCFIISLEGVRAGFIKTYLVASWENYARSIDAQPGWAGIDYFIGEPRFRGRGLAAVWIRRFLDDVVFSDPEVTACVSGPNSDNAASVRALQRAGFSPLREVLTDTGDVELLHLLERPT